MIQCLQICCLFIVLYNFNMEEIVHKLSPMYLVTVSQEFITFHVRFSLEKLINNFNSISIICISLIW